MFVITSLLVVTIVLYVLWDVNYFLRALFTVVSGRIYQQTYSLFDTTTVYGMGTFQDCDMSFRNIRLSRLARELDFARYYYYDRTGLYANSKKHGITSLQGSTLTVTKEEVPLFRPFKINTKLIYFDEQTLFFLHDVVTIHDDKLRVTLLSRQYAVGGTIKDLFEGLPGSNVILKCPNHIRCWIRAMLISSQKLREPAVKDRQYK